MLFIKILTLTVVLDVAKLADRKEKLAELVY